MTELILCHAGCQKLKQFRSPIGQRDYDDFFFMATLAAAVVGNCAVCRVAATTGVGCDIDLDAYMALTV